MFRWVENSTCSGSYFIDDIHLNALKDLQLRLYVKDNFPYACPAIFLDIPFFHDASFLGARYRSLINKPAKLENGWRILKETEHAPL